MDYRIPTNIDDLIFEIKEDNEEQYLQITQCNIINSGSFTKEKIFIDRSELLQSPEIGTVIDNAMR